MSNSRKLAIQLSITLTNTLLQFLLFPFSSFMYTTGLWLQTTVSILITVWGVHTLVKWSEKTSIVIVLYIIIFVLSLGPILSGLAHLIQIITFGWYPPL